MVAISQLEVHLSISAKANVGQILGLRKRPYNCNGECEPKCEHSSEEVNNDCPNALLPPAERNILPYRII